MSHRCCPKGSKLVVKHGAKISGCFCERKPQGRKKGYGYRWKQSGRAWLLIACPKPLRRGRCPVGTRAFAILTPCR